MLVQTVATFAIVTGSADPQLETKAQAILDDACTYCHGSGGDPNDPADIDLSDIAALVGRNSVVNGKPLVTPGDPKNSYLLTKMTGEGGIDGELMPLDGDKLADEQLQVFVDWIESLPVSDPDVEPKEKRESERVKPFHGPDQIVLPTTTTLGRMVLQYRIDHRFGRIGTPRGAFGLDAGAVMSLGIAIGIFDGWDVRLRRTNSYKGWELGTKYIPIRQEDGRAVSFGFQVTMDWFRDEGASNPISGNAILMLSRLWFSRWSTLLTASVHWPTNHTQNPEVDFEDGTGPSPANDRRSTIAIGLATTVWLGRARRWGLELEYIQPIYDSASPNIFYFRGGDTDPGGPKIGDWGLGGSYYTGKHFFQVFFTNNREIHMNLAAPGGSTVNPFNARGVDPKNPFHDFNFYLGFNLGRSFKLGVNAKRWKTQRAEKKHKRMDEKPAETTPEDPDEPDEDMD